MATKAPLPQWTWEDLEASLRKLDADRCPGLYEYLLDGLRGHDMRDPTAFLFEVLATAALLGHTEATNRRPQIHWSDLPLSSC